MTTSHEPGRTAYEARYAHTTLGPRGLGGPAWDALSAEGRAVWARVEAMVRADADREMMVLRDDHAGMKRQRDEERDRTDRAEEELARVMSAWSFDMATAPRDGSKVDLIYPYPRGRTIDCFWGRSELYGGDTWIFRKPTWRTKSPGGLLPEKEWETGCYPNMQPVAWRRPDVPAVEESEAGPHA